MSVARGFLFFGSSSGRVRELPGFIKGRHIVPQAATSAAREFVSRIGAPLVDQRIEDAFQRARAALSLRRRDLAISRNGDTALLATPSFEYEARCALVEDDPSRYHIECTLRLCAPLDEALVAAIDAVFPLEFHALHFTAATPCAVEALIDALEDTDPDVLTVDYPSDCASCEVSLAGHSARLFYDGIRLEVHAPSPVGAADLFALCDAIARRLQAAGILFMGLS